MFLPRFSHSYFTLRNRFGMLVETHSWKDYPTRVRITRNTIVSLMEQIAAHGAEWRREAAAADARSRQLAGQLVALKSQINPHFLFNALNNLYALTIKKSDLAPEIVLKLSELMEYMLYESDEPYVPLEKEIKYLDNYLHLEKIRQGNQADIRLTVTGDIDKSMIPPFLLLPLVENAFKHGISRAVRNAYLHIDIRIDKSIEAVIENNKLNFQPNNQSGGIGLQNIRRRLELLYPGQHTLTITNEADLYRVTLKLDRTC